MALSAQQQVRHLYVGKKYPAHANVAAVKGGANGDLALLSADGTAVAAGEKFSFLKKNKAGVITSDIINPSNVTYARSKAYVAPVLGSTTISSITANANTLYTVEIAIRQFGSLSGENEYIKKAFYKAKTGDDAENIVDGLVKSLARNFKREEPTTSATFAYTSKGAVVTQEPDNLFFSFSKTGTGASAALVITEKSDWADQTFDADRRHRENIDFVVNAKFTTDPVVTSTGSKVGVGTGKQVAVAEFYLKGERNDYMRGAGYPHNFTTDMDADTSASYNVVELGYYEEGRDEAKKSRKQVTIYMPDSEKTAMNVMIANLNTILGAGTVALIP